MRAEAPAPPTLELRRLLAAFLAALLLGASMSAAIAVPVHAQQQVADPQNSDAVVTGPSEIAYGQEIEISGTGFLTPEGEPSVLAVLLDARVSGDPNTVHTTREVTNPLTGEVSSDKRLHVIVEAQTDGSFTASIPFPTQQNSSVGNSTAAWEPGTTHEFRVLTGSFRPGDHIRSIPVEFEIAAEDEDQPQPTPEPTESPSPSEPAPEDPGADDPSTDEPRPTDEPSPTDAPDDPADPATPPGSAPEWPHVEVTHDSGAVAWIQEDVEASPGSTIRIRGTGWTTSDGSTGSTTAIKLNSSATAQYTRSGQEIVTHPSAAGDDTIWALLAPENTEDHPHVHAVDEDGTFEIEIQVPEDLTPGQYLSVLFQSGRFADGDVTRAVTSESLVVGGEPFEGDTDVQEEATCVPGTTPPTVEIENPVVGFGDLLTVHGTGWCHPEENRGASVIAIKIDEGEYSRLDDALHQNRTIWHLVDDADPATGNWTAEIEVPDGTDATSEPALVEGAHTLRLLTGSLKPADAPRTVLSEEFVVGEYQPLGPPGPVEADEDLTDSAQGPVRIRQTARHIEVSIPGAQDGDWIFLTGFAQDGSPRLWWGATWFQVEDERVRAPLADIAQPIPEGAFKLAVQSGNQGELGTLLGWGWVHGTQVQQPRETSSGSTPRVGSQSQDGASPGERRRTPSTGGSAVEQPTGSLDQVWAQSLTPGALGWDGLAAVPPVGGGLGWEAQLIQPESPLAQGAPAQDPEPIDEDELTGATAGNITAELEDDELTLSLADAEPGDWVFVTLHPGAQVLGWIEADEERAIRIDVAGMPFGEYRFAVQNAEGELLGWAEVIHQDTEDSTADSDAAPMQVPEPIPGTGDAGDDDESGALAGLFGSWGMGAGDWALIALGAGVLLGVGVALFATGARTAPREGVTP